MGRVIADFWESYVERLKIRWALTAIAVFLISMVMSCQEFRYMVKGQTADAKLQNYHIEKDPNKGTSKAVIAYTYTDKDQFRLRYADVPPDWPGLEYPTVRIQYIPGREDSSRIAGDPHWFWPAIFFGSLAVAAFGVVMIVREK